LTARFSKALSNWAGSRWAGSGSAARLEVDAHRLADRLAQQRREVGDQHVEIDGQRVQALAAREGQQLAGQGPALLGRQAHRLDLPGQLVLLAGAPLDQLDIAQDHGQQVVEVVGDAAGQLADRLHLAGVAQLLLQAPALGVVQQVPNTTGRPLSSSWASTPWSISER
jgi:hypothetical protein